MSVTADLSLFALLLSAEDSAPASVATITSEFLPASTASTACTLVGPIVHMNSRISPVFTESPTTAATAFLKLPTACSSQPTAFYQ